MALIKTQESVGETAPRRARALASVGGALWALLLLLLLLLLLRAVLGRGGC